MRELEDRSGADSWGRFRLVRVAVLLHIVVLFVAGMGYDIIIVSVRSDLREELSMVGTRCVLTMQSFSRFGFGFGFGFGF